MTLIAIVTVVLTSLVSIVIADKILQHKRKILVQKINQQWIQELSKRKLITVNKYGGMQWKK